MNETVVKGELKLTWEQNPSWACSIEWGTNPQEDSRLIHHIYGADISNFLSKGRICVSEEVWAIYLDTYCNGIGYSMIGKGDIRTSVVDIQAMLFTALKVRAQGVVIVHNHPHEATPHISADDEVMVEAIHKALTAVRIAFIDFVIVGQSVFTKDTELLKRLNELI
jgi:hypothetical protein